MSVSFPYFKAEQIAERSWMIYNAFIHPTVAYCYLVEGKQVIRKERMQ